MTPGPPDAQAVNPVSGVPWSGQAHHMWDRFPTGELPRHLPETRAPRLTPKGPIVEKGIDNRGHHS